MLKEVAPATRHAAVMVNPDNPGALQLTQSAASAASPLGLDVKALNVRTPEEIERALASFAAAGDAGLVVPPDPSTNTHRKVIVELAAKLKLPTIYALRIATAEGGLMSYGIDVPSLFRNAASYADRILRGEKPANLPVQQPDKFEMVINLKVARSLGLNIPQSLLATADEVIQ